ncbi:hypothetical protein GCM10029964_080240 [Kibdelosporangium lantanae]
MITWGADLQLWDVSDRTAPRLLRTVNPNRDSALRSVAVSPDGKWTVSTSDDDVRLTDMAASAVSGLNESGARMAFATTGNVLFGGAGNGSARFWDVTDPVHPKPHWSLTTPAGETVSAARMTPDGKAVATEVSDLTTQLWDMTGPLPRRAATIDDTAEGLAISPDSRLLATSANSIHNTAGPPRPDPAELDVSTMTSIWTKIWDITDVDHPKHIVTLEHKSTGNDVEMLVTSRAFTADGRLLATATGKGHVQVWRVTDANPTAVLDLTGKGTAVATGPGGLVTFADATGSAELWSVGGNVHQLSSVSGHNGPAGQVVISPDGHTLATGGADGTVRLWNIEDPTEPRLTAVLSGHTKPVYGVAFSPDGHTIATSSDDGTVRQS